MTDAPPPATPEPAAMPPSSPSTSAPTAPTPTTHPLCPPHADPLSPSPASPWPQLFVFSPDGRLVRYDPKPPAYAALCSERGGHYGATRGASPYSSPYPSAYSPPYSSHSSPYSLPAHTGRPDESTPLLATRHTRRGTLWSILAGELEDGACATTRFWKPLEEGRYWRSVVHLALLNLPFTLLTTPLLLTSTLLAPLLLLTLPLGAVFWWATLLLARWAARVEVDMQVRFHLPCDRRGRAVFYRPRQRLGSQEARVESGAEGAFPDTARRPSLPAYTPYTHVPGPVGDVEWDRRFLACSWAMMTDPYSYTALAYFIIIKPLGALLSTLALLVLVPPAILVIPLLPVVLRAARRWGVWQARVALANL